MTKKLLALLLASAMVLAMMSGCGTAATSASESTPAQSETAAASAAPTAAATKAPAASVEESTAAEESSASAEEPVEYDSIADKYAAMSNDTNDTYKKLTDGVKTDVSYPLDGDTTFSMWRVFSSFIWSGLMDSYADMPTLPLIEEKTGCHMKFIEVSDSAAYEQYNLTIASGDYTDFMAMDYYSGGVTSAYDDDVIIDMTDLAKEHMPYYMAAVDTMDDYTKKSLYTDDGRMLRIWTLASNVISEQGLSYRADWADEFGIG